MVWKRFPDRHSFSPKLFPEYKIGRKLTVSDMVKDAQQNLKNYQQTIIDNIFQGVDTS